MANEVEMVRIESWARYGWLRHGFSTRRGGVSKAYGRDSDLNLGWTKEDDPASVAENRRRFLQAACGIRTGKAEQQVLKMVTVRQVHSASVRVLRKEDGALEGRLETAEGKAVLEGDGLITNLPGVMVAVGTADCVPVLVVDTVKRAVGAFHAGWRGTVAGIVEHGVAALRHKYGSRVEDMVAAVGPAIGVCCYAVGEEVRSAFAAKFKYAEELFREVDGAGTVGLRPMPTSQNRDMGHPDLGRPALHVDLWEANRRQLLDSGLKDGQITVVGECTACARDERGLRYFSHRGERGVAGRMLSAVGRNELI